ncbi:WD40 repeat-like protein [Fomitiporia mediterranea MF3/22]|uniref:WD40 repeat-like protein n=1 Tax=Fomitiporia mediterranea (strain MF3/22) TaxID=694068 RepID=UPI0004407B04|nr:WD40 repeat-like protein [Fomitiporia mediterranea MF3/22]EJD02476.1 WD40 repeat-like protein [Fomitiporia mediterranea MF3/22]
MALQQQLQHTPLSSNEGRFVHLEAIDVELTGTRPYPKLQIILEDESNFRHKSDATINTLELRYVHIRNPLNFYSLTSFLRYVKSGSKAVLSVLYIKGLRPQRTVDKVDVDFGPDEFQSGGSITFTGQESVATIKLSVGEPKSELDVARLVAPITVTALGLKVAMLDKLDRVLQICDLVLRLGVGASEVNPYAKAAASIVSTVFERFRNIPSFHNELVLIMEEVVELLPIMELILRRITGKEVQDIVQKFFEFVVVLSNNLKDYASKPPLKFILRNWYEPCRDEIQQVKAQLTAMTQSLNLGLQVNILGIATSIYEHQLTETENKALKCCRPPENSAYDPSRGCLAGTRTSVLQNVEHWVHSTDHRQRLYWIHGVAGCGKSSVADALEKRTILSGSFFCKRNIPQRRSAARLVRSLVYFLAQRVFAFKNAVLQHLVDDPDIADKPLSYQFNTLLAKPLVAVPRETDSVSMVIIVIDALDECEDSEIVASYLASAAQVASWLRLIVTSRPSPRIRENILRKEDLVQECDLFRVTTDEDIRLFAQDQFTSNPDLRNILLIPIDALVRKAAGHFIWISTVLKHVGMEPFGKSRLLQRIIDSDPRTSSSEGNLDAIYSRVLEDASQGSNRPLPSKAIRAFIPSELDAGQDELDALFKHLGSVLYEDNRTRAVRVCHPSFLDFVGSMERSGRFWTAVKELETNMTEKCLQILLDELKFNICHLETSYYANDDVLDLNYRIDRDIPQHLQYSCLYWFNHMCRSQNGETCKARMQQMLHGLLNRPPALYWLEALSILSEIRVAFTTLQELASVLKHSGADEDLVSMATDLFRFVGAFREPMVISAPHVYLSALLWAPVKSTVASCYSESFDIQQCILKGVNAYWPANLHTISTQSGVSCVTYSPDGRHISAGLYDKTVCIWDAETGAQVGTALEGHQGYVYSVAYSPDGRHIVSGCSDKTVRIWNTLTGAQVGTSLEGHQDSVRCVAYSPDGRYIVSGSKDKTMRIWDAETGAQVGTLLEGHEDSVWSVFYSPDGRHIVSGSEDKTMRIWDTLTGAQVGTPIEGHDGYVSSVACLPDGRHIVSGSEDKTVRIWDALTGKQVGTPLKGHQGLVVRSIMCSPDGRHIASAGVDDMTVRIWDTESAIRNGSRNNTGDSWDAYCFKDDRVICITEHTAGTPTTMSTTYSKYPPIIPSDGWIRTPTGGLFLWIPHEYQNGICDTSVRCILDNAPGHPVRIDWKSVCHGEPWTNVKIS